MERKITYCCGECGSQNVSADASAAWSVEDQCWTLSGVQDQKYCNDCDGETTLEMRDAETGEQVAYAPGRARILPKAEADALWQAEFERGRAIARQAAEKAAALKVATANAEALASWQEVGQ